MSKRFTKIICALTASTFIIGAVAVAGCSDYYSAPKLDGDYSGEVASNGGFAVAKGNYVYYINGVEDGTALNDFGTPVKGAIYRVAKDNLEKRNYSEVERVVPSIAYSSNYNGGIFIYGDRIYYGTPSTAKNSDGVVQNSYLDMKSTKLDGTETLKNAYVSFPSAAYEYRFVEDGEGENKTVYLLYVATDEKLYEEETGVKNLHSYNTATGEDTLLAYNVADVVFDSEDKTNARVYYTMSVYDYSQTSNTAYGYNQLYTVTAKATEDKFAGKLNKDTVKGWNDDSADGAVDRYVNCGDLVLDGIGYSDYLGNQLELTPFNTGERNDNVTNDLSYTYTVKQYANGSVYYTRTTSLNSNAYLFSLADGAEKQPVKNNRADDTAILNDGSAADGYKFVTVGNKSAVLAAGSAGGITINYFDENGKLGKEPSDLVTVGGKPNTYYPVVKANAGTATILNVDRENNFVYYSVSGGSEYTVNRVDYTGTPQNYNDATLSAEANENYDPVPILDLDTASGWYMPEIIDDYILFASTTRVMTSYKYIMVFDLDGMDNSAIRELNDKYDGIEETINDVFGNTDKYPEKTYANLKNTLWYAFFNGDYDYLETYAKELNDAREEDANLIYSDETLAEFKNFREAKGEAWEGYADRKTVNGKEVYANDRDYYYSLLGEMSEKDVKAYAESLQTNFLVAKAEEEPAIGWYEGLSTVEKTFFVIGMCLIGALVIGGGIWLTVYLVRSRRKQPEERRRRIKVDTTDDKSVDVYDYNE